MVKKESGIYNNPENQPQFIRPEFKSDNAAPISPSRLSRAKDRFNQKKIEISGAGAIVSVPYIVGFAEGLEPRDALIYGTLQWLTVGERERDGVSELTQQILSGGIKAVEATGVVGTGVKLGYDAVNRSEKRSEAIHDGTAEIRPHGEQIIVLGGTGSHVIDTLATSPERESFIPVLESSGAAHKVLTQYADKIKRNVPVYLNLGIHDNGNHRTRLSYLETEAWDLLKLSKDNLIQAANGHRYLLVVGCGETADRELSLEPQNVDVTHDDLRSSVLRLKALLKPDDLVEQRDIIDMYIGNAEIERKSAENRQRISDKELARKTGVDIYVDTWALVLRELAEKIVEGGSKEVILATTDDKYEERFRTRFAGHISNFDGCEELQLKDSDNAKDDAAWIVYEGASDETFQTARRMRKGHPKRRVIALLSNNKVENYVKTAEMENVEFICASSVLAGTIIGVKDLIKEGFRPDQIQELLDEYAPSVL